MISKLRAISNELARSRNLRVAFALMPFRGSDREVGWSALECDQAANRPVAYVTSPSEFRVIQKYFPENYADGQKQVLVFGSVRVVAWPFDISHRFMPIGYVRFLTWVITLQLYLMLRRKSDIRKVHFLTYTQLATPIILPKPVSYTHLTLPTKA